MTKHAQLIRSVDADALWVESIITQVGFWLCLYPPMQVSPNLLPILLAYEELHRGEREKVLFFVWKTVPRKKKLLSSYSFQVSFLTSETFRSTDQMFSFFILLHCLYFKIFKI